jgi:hypothetical protein
VTGNAALLKNGLDIALEINPPRGIGLSGKPRIYGNQNYPHEPVSPYRHARILPELYSRAACSGLVRNGTIMLRLKVARNSAVAAQAAIFRLLGFWFEWNLTSSNPVSWELVAVPLLGNDYATY